MRATGSAQLELIEVLPQERKSRSGRFAVARLRLTRKACELVGLIETNDEVIHTPPHDKMSDRHTLTEPTISKNQRTALVGALPQDLAWLTGQGLSRAGIFKLMGQAKQHGKGLPDIVTVVASYLRDLKGGKLFAYLSALACGPTDFSVAAANERQRQQDAAEAQRVKARAKLFRQRFAGTTLTNRAQTKLYVIDAQARFVEVVQAGYSVTGPLREEPPPLLGFPPASFSTFANSDSQFRTDTVSKVPCSSRPTKRRSSCRNVSL